MGGGMSIEMWRAERNDVAVQARLQRRVFEEFGWETGLDAHDLAVDVTSRTVTLSGSVSTYPQKIAAGRAAKRVRGVQQVVNNIAVALRAADERNDRALARTLARAYQADVLVPWKAIRVSVVGGIVQLEGEVADEAARQASEHIATCLVGVRHVVNLIAVKAGPAPENLKERIEAAIERSAELQGDRITVDLWDDTVALSGRVRSLAEREEVERAVKMVPGVSAIRDDVEIGGKA